MITIQVSKPWQVKTPTVFRYMNQKYINDFFEKGHLRLSTFKTFARHEDEQRLDKDEGNNFLVGRNDEQTITAWTKHGQKSLIFCTSTRGDEKLMQDFGTNGYFKIKDTTKFGATVANKIAGFNGGIEGFCDYKDKRIIERKINKFDLDEMRENEEDKNVSMEKLFSKVSEVGGPNVFFTKLKKYSHQNEYRFIWNVSTKVEEAMFIECPEAVEFCEKVT